MMRSGQIAELKKSYSRNRVLGAVIGKYRIDYLAIVLVLDLLTLSSDCHLIPTHSAKMKDIFCFCERRSKVQQPNMFFPGFA